MKYLKWFLFILLIIILNSTAFALNLDVDSDLNDFAQDNLLKENETQNLNNPFFLKIQEEETAESDLEEDVELPIPENEAENLVEEAEVNPKPIETEPEIVINGAIMTSNSRLALLISYQQQRHLLKIGDNVDGYKLTTYQDGEATFIKNGREINISY